jgi:hypothetical protein
LVTQHLVRIFTQIKIMVMDGQFLKHAFELAGAVGQFQGLIKFVRQNPEAYSHEQLLNELFKVDDAVNAKLKELD